MKFFPNLRDAVQSRHLAWLTIVASFAALLGWASIQAPAEAFQNNGKAKMVLDLNASLRKEIPKIKTELDKRGYKNVGVLKFKVKINDRGHTMHAGRLNQQMATRLENALVLINLIKNPKEPLLGVTRDAGQEAMKNNKKATWLTEDGRAELLKGNYPLAWGNKSEPVDAFLTGVIELNAKKDSKEIGIANVQIQVFDKKDSEPKELTSFQAKLTPALMAEAGQRFVVETRTLKTSTGGNKVDQIPVIPADTSKKTAVDEDFDNVLQFQIFYNGEEIKPNPAPNGAFQCKPPLVNDKIVFKMKSTEKIGLVLFVNGINTLEMARADSADIMQQTRWILNRGEEYTIEGFYPTFKKADPFKSAPVEEAEPGDLGPEDKWGLIELHVLKEAGNEKELLPTTSNLQGSVPRQLDLSSLMDQLKKPIDTAPARKLIIPDKLGTKDADIKEVPFNGTLYASRTIIYSK